MRKAIIAAAVLSSGGAFAHGGGDTGDVGEHEYISVLPSYEIVDEGRAGKRNGGSASLIYGHNLTPHFGIELNGNFLVVETGNGNGTDFYRYSGTVDAVYTFNDRQGPALLHPFLLAGVGGAYNDVTPDSRDGASLIYGGGVGVVTADIYHGIRLRLEGRYVRDEFGPGFEDIRASFGIEIPLGRVVERTIEAPAPPPQIVEVVKEVALPFVDSDGDTVPDERDKCPDTPRGLKVDADGCVIPDQIIELKGVTFEFNKTRLTPNAEAVLDTVVKAFIGQPSLKVEIGGHTDSRGKDAYNQKLSQGRADSVRAYLVSQGAKPDQLTAVGYGETQLLIKPETNDDDYELNRRVEFKVIGK
ncbi:OmpA family protein [Nevskia sp.]|uniref:OmpA family protein n=1 Tax=Nevskia sp. TaxID=1929292 RepID=UPI0025DCA45D|nr:OmpA family protein [Nevskia sp.]